MHGYELCGSGAADDYALPFAIPLSRICNYDPPLASSLNGVHNTSIFAFAYGQGSVFSN